MNKIVVVSVNLIMTERRRLNASSKKPVTKKDFSPQISGTATLLNRWGDITVLGGRVVMLDRNSDVLKARLVFCRFKNCIIKESRTVSNAPMQLSRYESRLLLHDFSCGLKYL
jgi:hypothetical protein